jgi:hypothetical protein
MDFARREKWYEPLSLCPLPLPSPHCVERGNSSAVGDGHHLEKRPDRRKSFTLLS